MFLEPMLASSVTEKKRATLTSEKYLLEPKHDGMRAVISKYNNMVRIFSRVGLEYTEHLPYLVEECNDLPNGTVLDGELMVVKERVLIGDHEVAVADFNATMRIMGSNPDKAIKRQEDHKIEFCVFDLPRIDGFTLESADYHQRIEALSALVARNNFSYIFQNAVIADWNNETIDQLWEAGIEGAILKNIGSLYIPGKRRANTWYKIKSVLTADVVVMGYTDAKEGKTGKFLGKVGALVFGAYNAAGELVEVGQCSGMNDAERDRWTAIRDSKEDLTRVIEVKYNDLVGSGEFGTPRHPQFKTERIDKRPEDCLLGQFRLTTA